MLALIFSLLPPASAFELVSDADMACEPAWLSDTLPGAEQTGVPLDASLTLLLDGDCGETRFRVALTEADSGSLILDEEVYADIGWLALTPAEPLRPSTAYTLTIEPLDGWGSLTTIPFETGEADAVGMEAGAPSIEIPRATVERTDRRWFYTTISLTITPVADPDQLSLIELRGINNNHHVEQYRALDSAEPFDVSLSWSSTDQTGEVCFEVVQYDTLGGSAASGVTCAQAEETGYMGCSTAGGAAGLLALLPGVLALFRRRR